MYHYNTLEEVRLVNPQPTISELQPFQTKVVGGIKVQMSIKDYLDSLGTEANVANLYYDVKNGVLGGTAVVALLANHYSPRVATAIGLVKAASVPFVAAVYASWIDRHLMEIATTVNDAKNAMEHNKTQIEIVTNFEYYNTGRVSGPAIVFQKGSKSVFFR